MHLTANEYNKAFFFTKGLLTLEIKYDAYSKNPMYMF